MNGEGFDSWSYSCTHPNDYDPWSTQEPVVHPQAPDSPLQIPCIPWQARASGLVPQP